MSKYILTFNLYTIKWQFQGLLICHCSLQECAQTLSHQHTSSAEESSIFWRDVFMCVVISFLEAYEHMST